MRLRSRDVVACAAAMVLVGGLAACGSSNDSGSGSTSGSGKTTSLKYIYDNSAPIPAYTVAKTNGYFTKNGLKVSEVDIADPGAGTTALVGGQAEIGDVPLPTAMLAIAKGAAIKIVGAESYGFTGTNNQSYQAADLVAPKSTGITSLKDLAGKRIAVASLGSEYYFELKGLLQQQGVNVSSVKFVAIPYTGMVAAMSSKQADAALILSTNFDTLNARTPSTILSTGSELLGLPMEVPSVIAVSTDFLKSNPTAVTEFLESMLQAEDWVQQDLTQNKGVNAQKQLQAVTKYPDSVMTSYMKFRVDGLGLEKQLTNRLGVPTAVIDAQTKLLHSSGQLPASTPLDASKLLDTGPLQAAFKALNLTWSTNPQLPD